MSTFELAGGRVLGREHAAKGVNCQDALAFLQVPALDTAIAVVCDGCTNSLKSEVGAGLISRFVTESIQFMLLSEPASTEGTGAADFWEFVRMRTLDKMRNAAKGMGGSLSETIGEHFLCTIVAAIIGPDYSEFVAIGDGEVIVNGERISIGPFPGNEPPYLAYALTGSTLTNQDPGLLRFRIVRRLPSQALRHFAIGTDGLSDLIAAEYKTFPGTVTVIGPISQLWEDDKFFRNKDNVRRFLAMANVETNKVDWHALEVNRVTGLLKDDTAIVVGRRFKAPTEKVAT
jgi:hypothetical protein